jgi:hypothetical protein
MLTLYNKSVVRIDVFMGLRFLVGYVREQRCRCALEKTQMKGTEQRICR